MKKSPLDRLFSLFSDVRAGEGATALPMLLNIFVLLVCYSVNAYFRRIDGGWRLIGFERLAP
jgi:hypothetical protein